MASWQKAKLEKNHEYIRKVIPKGQSLDAFEQKDITTSYHSSIITKLIFIAAFHKHLSYISSSCILVPFHIQTHLKDFYVSFDLTTQFVV
jgi:hypothetical protein